jgi:hypothetical protein
LLKSKFSIALKIYRNTEEPKSKPVIADNE